MLNKCPSAAKSAPNIACCDSLEDLFQIFYQISLLMILKSVLNQACIALNCSHGTDFVFFTFDSYGFLEAVVARFVLIEKVGR